MDRSYKQQVAEHFGKADSYDEFAFIQKAVARKLAESIKALNLSDTQEKPLSILEIGCGTGLLTEHLLVLFPKAHITLTDIAPEMIERVKDRFAEHKDRLSFKVMDGEHPELDEKFDLICSSLVVQWFHNLPDAMKNLSAYLKPNGYLVLSTLAKETFKEWRESYANLGYPCSLQTYPDMDALNQLWQEEEAYSGKGVWQEWEIIDRPRSGLEFMQRFRAIGADMPVQTIKKLSAGQLKKVMRHFDQNYGYSTYQVALGQFQRFAAKGFFVTGTDTDVGKTFISACLTQLLDAIYWKPIQTGLNCDIGDTRRVTSLIQRDERIMSPLIALQAPLSPEEAAKQEKISLSIEAIDFPVLDQEKTYIVEGAGGIMVPITQFQYMTDLMKRINLPVILVARTKLGTLNHTLMTIRILREQNIAIAGVVLNGKINAANRRAIQEHGKVSILAEIQEFETISPETVKQCLPYFSIPSEFL